MAARAGGDIAKLGFEAALKELEDIVEKLEGGEGLLEDAISSYERGIALKKHCEAKLREAQTRVEKVVSSLEGGIDLEPADID